MQPQAGDEQIVPFFFVYDYIGENQVLCHLTYTNEKTHQIIKDNLHRSPLYSGKIEGVGPRYCPSIEDKVVRERNRLFRTLEFCESDGGILYAPIFPESNVCPLLAPFYYKKYSKLPFILF